MLTTQQIDEIRKKSGLNTVGTGANYPGKYDSLAPQEPKNDVGKSFVRKVGDFFTASTQKFGETLGAAASVIDKGAIGKVANYIPGVKGEEGTSELREETLASTNKMVDDYIAKAKSEPDKARAKKYLEAANKLADTEDIDVFNNPEYQKTAKQILGEAAGTALETLSFGTYGKAATTGMNSFKLGKATIPTLIKPILSPAKQFLKATAQGAKTGFVYGTTYGASQAAQENKSNLDILGSGLKSGAIGAVTGGVLSGGLSAAGQGLSWAGKKGEELATKGKVLLKKGTDKVTDIISPIDKGVKTVLNKPEIKIKMLQDYEKVAKEALLDYSKPTPLEMAGNKADIALKQIKQGLEKSGSSKKNITQKLGKINTGTIVTEAQETMRKLLKDRTGLVYTVNGNFKNASNRLSTIADKKDLALIKNMDARLSYLSKNPTFQKVDDTIDLFQDMLYKGNSVGSIPTNKQVVGIMKSVIGELNGKLKEIGGKEYTAANVNYANNQKVFNVLNKALGIDSNKGASLMKQLFSPSGTAPRKLFARVKEITGIDLVDEATLAKFVMENVGDVRQASLLEQAIKGNVPTSARGLIQMAAEKTIGKLQNPLGKAKRIINQRLK